MDDREVRCYSGEVRAEQHSEQPTHIIGYGSVFNSRSEPLWGFREIIKPGAFDDVLNDDVRGLFNHDPNFILGRSAAGTLSLSVDEKGLRYDITAPETQTIRDLVLAPMFRGDIVENYDLFKKYLIVERDANNPNRLNTLFPPDYINQLRVFAVVNQFRLQYPEETA
ncbi:HK97 family phage prohead protease [Kosakonia sp. SOY2]|uniref:HK97 family phage prohead protease n=1 Tax=Kosakonia sp. SOY2 TaxID=3014557 RepID=UPI003FA56EAF